MREPPRPKEYLDFITRVVECDDNGALLPAREWKKFATACRRVLGDPEANIDDELGGEPDHEELAKKHARLARIEKETEAAEARNRGEELIAEARALIGLWSDNAAAAQLAADWAKARDGIAHATRCPTDPYKAILWNLAALPIEPWSAGTIRKRWAKLRAAGLRRSSARDRWGSCST